MSESICYKCKEVITHRIITALGKTWHPEHFACKDCQFPIEEATFNIQDGEPVCSKCFLNNYSGTCHGCKNPILERTIKALGLTWHEDCFCCGGPCNKPLVGTSFYEREGKAYCKNDFEALFAARCAGCFKPITENAIVALDAKWHRDCFKSGSLCAPQSRIVGGDDAILGQIPYQAALSIAGLPTCGAVIISERYALTSLQCVCSAGSDKPWPPQMFTITAGTTDLYNGGSRIVLEKITVNPNYNDLTTGIALLKLSQPLILNDYIQPIALSKTIPPVGAEIEISGWGRTKHGENDMYRTLQINDAILIDASECFRTIGSTNDEVLCLGHTRKNGICQGDFGSPAVYHNQLVGIAASVLGECGSFLPDVFTSMAFNYNWIMEQIM
ncbi:serine protease SP24D isoform X2 [Lucilia cuprina]|uniref:serine protease SP24D isoform X2 n=1 Tax=Lucilia cuprina TaxID=7375 RepID=UPI001F06C247|nr:serine protease SP24D isoform X2 [Lucilia cuprina]